MIHGVPTALSPREQTTLQQYAVGRRVIEAGALLGGSTIVLAQVAVSVISIDKHEGYSAPTFTQFMSNLQRAGIYSKVQPLVADIRAFDIRFNGDISFIDLTGQYDLTKEVLSKLSTDIVAVHDICRSKCEGVEKAIKDAGLKVIEHVDSLAICVR